MKSPSSSANVYTSTPKPVLRKSTAAALLSSKISIPRVSSYHCDQCGHRMSRVGSYQEPFANNPWASYRGVRPHSLFADPQNFDHNVSFLEPKILFKPNCGYHFVLLPGSFPASAPLGCYFKYLSRFISVDIWNSV